MKLVSAFSEKEEPIEVISAESPISGRTMEILECNGIPVYVDLKDRVCLPVEENKKVL